MIGLRRLVRHICTCLVVLCFLPLVGHAVDRTISQYLHTAWTAKDGSPRLIQAIAQTVDGFLWLGTADGLYRFDGVNFERFDEHAKLSSTYFTTLFAEPNGNLWFAYGSGHIALLRNGKLRKYSSHDGLPNIHIRALIRDHQGVLWATTSGGLMYLADDRWRYVEASKNFPGGSASAIAVDREGTLWVSTDHEIVCLRAGAKTFQPTGASVGQTRRLAQAPDGQMWIAETSRSVRPVLPDKDANSSKTPEIKVGSINILFDKAGSLWITTLGDGLLRSSDPKGLSGKLTKSSSVLESFTDADGLTDNLIEVIFQDREGNIWVGTKNGLDLFREVTFVPANWPLLKTTVGIPIAPGDNGDIWVSVHGHLALIQDGKITESKQNFITSNVSYRDAAGVLWWPGQDGIIRIEKGRLSLLPLPRGFEKPCLRNLYLSGDDTGQLWLYADEKGIFYRKAGSWHAFEPAPKLNLSNAGAVFKDEYGSIWFGEMEGSLLRLKDGVLKRVFSAQKLDIGSVLAIDGRAGHMWIGGPDGLVLLHDNKLLPILSSDGTAFEYVSGIVETADGDLWLAEKRGVIHVRRENVQQILLNPSHPISTEVFDAQDGAPSASWGYVSSRATQGTDGRIWFAGWDGMAWLDPTHIIRNNVPPPVVIRAVQADRRSYSTESGLRLPALMNELQITYAALSLSVPRRVRFRYKLEGSDHEWQDVGNRREAFYTRLDPGSYTFHVIACNNDGVWNEQGATLRFTVAPAWFQTTWFRTSYVVLALVSVYGIYRFRFQQIAKAMNDRFNERLAERTRLAQELHDTVLQTVQGSQLITVDALAHTADPDRTRIALEQISEFLTQATTEGRAALHALRSSTTETNDLAAALRRALEDCRREKSMETDLVVKGDSSQVHPLVRDEIYRIAYEAIRNACVHSAAARVNVVLTYANELRLLVRDNGQGIESDLLNNGRTGHFGLQGMRERAERIGAKLSIESKVHSGTEIELVVPGNIAFRFQRSR